MLFAVGYEHPTTEKADNRCVLQPPQEGIPLSGKHLPNEFRRGNHHRLETRKGDLENVPQLGVEPLQKG
jgi:hypothetical protein